MCQGVRRSGADVNLLQDLNVVVKGDGAHGDGQDHEPEQTEIGGVGGRGSGEQVKFSEESGERRNAGEREHEDQHAKRENRRAAAQSCEGAHFVTAALFLNHRDDAESADGGKPIGEDIIDQRGQSLAIVGHNAEQHIAGMGDR